MASEKVVKPVSYTHLANSALLVGVTPADYGDDHPLAGMAFQREIEEAAFRAAGGYRAPAQRVGDFLEGRASSGLEGAVHPTYLPGVKMCIRDRYYSCDRGKSPVKRLQMGIPSCAGGGKRV